MYQILLNGIVVENYVQKSELTNILNYWKQNGMSGKYTTCKHSVNDLLNRVW